MATPKSTLIAQVEALIATQNDTGPVFWSVEDHGDAVLLVGTYDADSTTDDGYELTDEPWKIYGGDEILEGLPPHDNVGMEGYRDKWGDDVVSQWVLWRVEG